MPSAQCEGLIRFYGLRDVRVVELDGDRRHEREVLKEAWERLPEWASRPVALVRGNRRYNRGITDIVGTVEVVYEVAPAVDSSTDAPDAAIRRLDSEPIDGWGPDEPARGGPLGTETGGER